MRPFRCVRACLGSFAGTRGCSRVSASVRVRLVPFVSVRECPRMVASVHNAWAPKADRRRDVGIDDFVISTGVECSVREFFFGTKT